MSIKRSFTFIAILALLATVLSLSSVPVSWAKGPTRLYVPADYETISGALDAASLIPQPHPVEILVAPGVYVGQLVIARPNTSLIGLSGPQHDERGFLAGFAAPVEIRNEGTLLEGSIVLISASNVRFEGFVVTRTGGGSEFVGAIVAGGHEKGSEREEILEEIVIRNNLLMASPGIAVGIQQANVKALQNTSIDCGKYGIIVQGGDSALGPMPHVKIARNHFANQKVGVFLSASVFGFGEIGRHTDPSSLGAEVRDNKIEQSGDNITAIFRSGADYSPKAEARLHLQVRDNLLGAPAPVGCDPYPVGAGSDLTIHAGGQTAAAGAEPGHMVIQWKGNTRPSSSMGSFSADISFAKFSNPAFGYVANSTILLIDTGHSFGDINKQEGNLDLGTGYGNTFAHRP